MNFDGCKLGMVNITIKFPEKTFLSDRQNFNETIIKF